MLLITSRCVEIDPGWHKDQGAEDASEDSTAPSDGDSTVPSGDGDGDGDGDGTSDTSDAGDSVTGDSGETDGEGPVNNLVFVTDETFTVDEIGGVSGADLLCQSAADDAGIPGTFQAWLSTLDGAARDRFAGARGWVRLDGRPVAEDLTKFPNGTYYSPDITESGARLVGDPVWSGTAVSGGASDPWGSSICSGWTSTDGTAGFGWAGATGWMWAATAWGMQCAAPAHLYCFSIDRVSELDVESTVGRVVFVSAAKLAADAGRDAADTLCQQQADDAGRSGTFLALMAVPGEAPLDRFNLDGAPWVRVDGLPILEPDELLGDRLALGIGYTATGELVGWDGRAWLGTEALDEPATEDSTCAGWTDVAWPSVSPLANTLAADWLGWQAYAGTECESEYPVLCFEQ